MKKIDVFDVVKPYNNDIIGSMENKDLYKFLAYLNKYILSMRESIGLSKEDTFGIEIEVDNFSYNKFNEFDSKIFENFAFEREDSIDFGIEAISQVLIDDASTWLSLINVCNKLSQCSNISKYCGGHIHVGLHLLKGDVDNYIKLSKIFAAYENVIFRFGYGEYLAEREYIDKYYLPISEIVYSNILNGKSNLLKFYLDGRCGALNFSFLLCQLLTCTSIEKGKTVEFRNPNGSLNPIIWQNNINFFVKLIKYASSTNFNDVLIMRRLDILHEKSFQKNLNILYRDLDVNAAVELADLIFDNNVDKVYFLRQYIKNYEVGKKSLEKGTKFTKCKNY